MPIDYKKYPANWKTEIRPDILNRDNHRCKFCGVDNYAVGYHDESCFVRVTGNEYYVAAGYGELSYTKARELAKHLNTSLGDRVIVIVLTVAHLDHDINNNDYSNLAVLCQRCHNRHDIGQRKENRKANRGIQKLF